MSDEKQESVSDYKNWLSELYDVTKMTDEAVYELYLRTYSNEHLILPDSLLIYAKNINFEQYHQAIAQEFHSKSRNFRINFWVNEENGSDKSFIVSIQNTTNEKPDDIQYVLDQWKYDNFKYKFKKYNTNVLRHKLVLNWKIETKHGANKLPMLSDAIKAYL